LPVYVLYEGRLIDKRYRPARPSHAASDLPAPTVMSLEAYLSPIDDAPVTSHRQRDRDLYNSGSYDRRDTPASFRKAQDARRKSNQRSAAEPPRYS
jgi:hypothetical protein